MAIDATEIKRQAGRVKEQLDKYSICTHDVRTALDNIASYSKSQDSNLSNLLTFPHAPLYKSAFL